MKPVSIIGMGLSPEDLTAKHLKLIKQADILIGGKRHLDFFKDYPAVQKEITRDIKGVIRYVKSQMKIKSIVILASGDPLFFGIGSLLINSLGPENVVIYPNISSVAAAFSRIRESWHDVHVMSMHGRNNKQELFESLAEKDKIAIFTDSDNNPAWIANLLLEKKIIDFNMCVLEQLNTPSERVNWYNLARAAEMEFAEPNLVVLKRIPSQFEKIRNLYVGMPDNWYDHQNGLITKAEVRAVTLSKLRLAPDHIMWDLGAGSGSISIEASLFVTRGKIFALEQKPDRIKQIKNNQKRFGVNNLEIIHSVLPGGLDDLPVPDRVFIGGGGRDLEKIIKSACKHLKEGGIVVINTVLIQNIKSALDTLKQIGFQTEIVQVQISRGCGMPWGERLEAQNPVWIISGKKRKGRYDDNNNPSGHICRRRPG